MLSSLNLPLPFENDILAKNKITPLPMQYLGAKTRITNWILSSITSNFNDVDHFFDLMSGTGAVSIAAKTRGYKIAANDVQPYSYAILKSLFEEERSGLAHLSEKILNLKNHETLLNNGRGNYREQLQKEDAFELKANHFAKIWKEYQYFCQNTPNVKSMKDIKNLRSKHEWNLFISYYANTYFGVRQCLELDVLREYAETLPENLKFHLIAATISTMTFAVSSTTHLAQYLKPDNYSNAAKLIKRRRICIIDEVSKRLKNLLDLSLPIESASVTNLDYKAALEELEIDKKWVVYVDPPYFKEHYSRYYHVLDTFYLYDYPDLTHNMRLGDVTVGRYRQNRIVSDFGLKSKVKGAFRSIFHACTINQANIAISYASTSLITKEDIIAISKEFRYTCVVEEKELMHSAQGQPNNKNVTEYLFLFKYV